MCAVARAVQSLLATRFFAPQSYFIYDHLLKETSTAFSSCRGRCFPQDQAGANWRANIGFPFFRWTEAWSPNECPKCHVSSNDGKMEGLLLCYDRNKLTHNTQRINICVYAQQTEGNIQWINSVSVFLCRFTTSFYPSALDRPFFSLFSLYLPFWSISPVLFLPPATAFCKQENT